MIVYLIRNSANGKGYVGITTKTVEARFQAHLYLVAKPEPKHALHRAIRKYGIETFEMSILATAETWAEAQRLERVFIADLRTFTTEHGYNMTRGGDGALGRRMSEDGRARIAAAQRGKIHSQEFRDAVGARMRGKAKPVAQLEKMSAWQRGEGNHWFGKTLSAAHKAKISASLTGRKMPAEAIAKTAAALRGRPKTEEQKQKNREQALLRFSVPGTHPWIGRHHSKETKTLLALRMKEQMERGWISPLKGKPLSEETKRKISEKTQGRPAWNRGLPTSAEARHRQSVSQKERLAAVPHPFLGRQHTDETKAKIGAANRGHISPQRRPVVVNSVTYSSITEASQRSGYTRTQVKYGLKTGRFEYADPKD